MADPRFQQVKFQVVGLSFSKKLDEKGFLRKDHLCRIEVVW